jgi:hypothetical protein
VDDQSQGHQHPGNLGIAPPCKRHALCLRPTARQGRRLRPHLRGKNALVFQTEASRRCSVYPSSVAARISPPGRRCLTPGQSADCSTLDDHGQPGGCERERPGPEAPFGKLAAGGSVVLLQLSGQSHSWASSTHVSPPAQVYSHPMHYPN